MVRTIFLVLGLGFVVSLSQATRADDLMAGQFYGSGVHRYFAGDLRAAHGEFSAAIQAGTDDPRPYYYRALAYLRMGRQPEALADFAKGAELEAADINGTYQVSKALERVQGQSRLQLERYRVQARAQAQQRQEQQRRQRYAAARRIEMEQVQRANANEEERAPRRTVRETVREAPDPFSAPPAAESAAGDRDPFDAATSAADAPRAATAAEPADAFAAPPAPAANPANNARAPFGGPPPAAEKADAADPFGRPATPANKPADAADPFGAPPPAEKMPAEKGGAADVDPFGAPPASRTPAATPTAPVTRPTEDAANPFGASAAPTAKGADSSSDPFGASATPATPADAGTPNPFGAPAASDKAAPAAAADNPFGQPAPATSARPAANGAATKTGPGGGLFRALGRAVGVDAARGVAKDAMSALPIGGGRSDASMSSPAQIAPPGVPFRAPPPGARDMRSRAAPGQDANPFDAPPSNPPPAAADNPFGPPATGKAGPQTDPFAPPPGDMKKEAAGDNPFKDDPVQPGAKANPFGGAR